MSKNLGRARPRRSALGAAAVSLAAVALLASTTSAQAVPAPDAGGLGPVAVAPAPAVAEAAPEPAPRKGTAAYAQWYAEKQLAAHGWKASEMKCLVPMWIGESHWDYREVTGPYVGIPQTTAGVVNEYGYSMSDYRDSAEVQVKVGLRYIDERYGSPCRAWSFWKAQGAWQDDQDPSQWWGGWY